MAQAEAVLAEQGEWTCGGWEFGGVGCNEIIGEQCCQVVQLNDLGCAGRPFEVHGEARVAEVASRPDWSADLVPESLAVLSRSDRRKLAAYWRSVGLAEHASVASFARFTLDLMSMGAPASLLRSCQRAAADEVEHARLAFARASAYAGDPVGPGRFDPGAMSSRNELQIVVSAVIEGCVEETLSAALAAVAASQTTDATVTAVLRKIARDEERHAALAWSFVRWVADARPDLHDAIEGAFIAAIAAADEGSRAAAHDRPGLSAHGRLDGDVRRATIRATLRGVVDPARRAVVSV
jgi:hypothetical protein